MGYGWSDIGQDSTGKLARQLWIVMFGMLIPIVVSLGRCDIALQ